MMEVVGSTSGFVVELAVGDFVELGRTKGTNEGRPGGRGVPVIVILVAVLVGVDGDNPLFERGHRLLLRLLDADGGKTNTEGMHGSMLLKGVPLMGSAEFTIEEGNMGKEEVNILTDYFIQGQVMKMVMGLVDDEDGWNGPEYVAKHVYAIDFTVGSQLINGLEWAESVRSDVIFASERRRDGERKAEGGKRDG
jgi:hypothetical protein